MGQKGLVSQLGLVLEPDLVPGFMVPHSVLQEHDFEHILGFRVREFTLDDEGGNAGI